MALGLGNIIKFFGGGEPSTEEKAELFKQLTLMTLSRASAADSNIKAIEVDSVRAIIESVTGESVTAEDVKINANSKLFEEAPLEKYLASVGPKIEIGQRVEIAQALADVIKSDERISSREITFFNMVCTAFQLTPANIAGLIES